MNRLAAQRLATPGCTRSKWSSLFACFGGKGKALKPQLGTSSILLGRTRTLDSHASRLRRKLNASAETAYVLNVWGVGYRLVATAP
jgi:Transcriptional regulatory protein, C terminal